MFDFIHGDLLRNFEREKAEMEKRRLDMEKKQNQFRSILRRFEEDVKALMADGAERVTRKLEAVDDQIPLGKSEIIDFCSVDSEIGTFHVYWVSVRRWNKRMKETVLQLSV